MTFLFNIIQGKVSFYVILWNSIILSATSCDLGTMCLAGARKQAGCFILYHSLSFHIEFMQKNMSLMKSNQQNTVSLALRVRVVFIPLHSLHI